mgnify:CR=1 FL=1
MTSPTKPRIAIVGYGSQGRAHALNLRDSGFDVTIGLRPGGPTELKAKADGFSVKTPADAVKDAELVAILTPDMVQPQLYGEVIEPNIAQGACLLFAHGFNVHYGQIAPREDLDVILVAPKGPGALVRREYEIGRGVPSVYAIHQDKSGNAEQFALAYCAAHKAACSGAILRGVFLTGKRDVEWFFQDMKAQLPDAWARLAARAPKRRQHDLLAWYADCIGGNDRAAALSAVREWMRWEDALTQPGRSVGEVPEPAGDEVQRLIDKYRAG